MVTGDAEVKSLLPNSLTPIAPTPPEQIGLNGKQVGRNTGQVHGTSAAVKSVSAQPEQGSARLRVSGLSLSELARMASTRSSPLDKLNPVGSVTGSVNLSWKHVLADAFADLSLDIARASAVYERHQLPVSGSIRGRYGARSGRIDLSALNLTTPHSHLEASGTLGATSAALKLNANTTSLTEFEPMLTAMGNAPLPIELAGAASFNGTLNGRLPDSADCRTSASDELHLHLYASPRTPAPHAPAAPAKHKSWFHLASDASASASAAAGCPSQTDSRRPVFRRRAVLAIGSSAAPRSRSGRKRAAHHRWLHRAGQRQFHRELAVPGSGRDSRCRHRRVAACLRLRLSASAAN